MPYIQRDLTLTNGPPWGFRLYEHPYEGLIVSKVRRRSSAEMANLREGDHLIAINGVKTINIKHAEAVQIIDFASYILTLTIGRGEKVAQKRMETFYLENYALRNQRPLQELTTSELQLVWEKENSPPPVSKELLVQPSDPGITPISVKRLMTTYDPPLIDRTLKKKPYSDSSFYHDPCKNFPTVEEQIEMCRKVAESLEAPVNKFSTGAMMFERQKHRADKYVKEGPDPIPDPFENRLNGRFQILTNQHAPQAYLLHDEHPIKSFYPQATEEQLRHVAPPPPPPPPLPGPASFPGLEPSNRRAKPIPAPPPLPPGHPKTTQEFLEKIKKFPKSQHDQIDPQMCFDIAAALHASESRGARLFAKRKQRVAKFEMESQGQADDLPENSYYPKPQLISKLGGGQPIQTTSAFSYKHTKDDTSNINNNSVTTKKLTNGLIDITTRSVFSQEPSNHSSPRSSISRLVSRQPLTSPSYEDTQSGFFKQDASLLNSFQGLMQQDAEMGRYSDSGRQTSTSYVPPESTCLTSFMNSGAPAVQGSSSWKPVKFNIPPIKN